jgi:FMN phosphatase YigB (HAD superfamily)
MLIFIDFDDVLFNTKHFKKELVGVFLKNGVSQKIFFETYYDYPIQTKKGLKKYDPWCQIKILKEKHNLKDKKLKRDLGKLFKNTKKFLFPDSEKFLKNFSKKDLILISYGETQFQEIKIKNGGISKHFSQIIIGDQDKAELIKKFLKNKKDKNIFLLEDFPLHINAVKQKLPQVKVIRIKRKEGRYSQLPSLEADFEAKNLKEAEGIIQNSNIKQ